MLAAGLAQGYFVKPDLAGALYWYAQAVKQGYTYAKWNAGTMLILGEGVPPARIELGMALIEQAAECGEITARQFLSECYAHGMFGKSVDSVVSKEWADCAKVDSQLIEYGASVDIEAHGVSLAKPHVEWA